MRMRAHQVPEPGQRPGPVAMMRAGLVDVACAALTWPRISHGTQNARASRLQHVNNSKPGASAKHPQSAAAAAMPGGAAVPSSGA